MLPRIALRPVGTTIVLVLAALVLEACEDAAGPPDARVSTVEKVAGDGQQGPVGSALPQELVARALDSRGRPVRAATVTWTVTSGGGSLAREDARTDEDGETRVDWTLGTVAGEQTVSVKIGDAAPVTFTAEALAGPAQSLEIVPATVVLDAIDATQALQAVGTDAFGNEITGRAASWTSLDEGVAEVSATGVVTAVANGTTRVQATMDGVTAEADVTVEQVAVAVEVEPAAPVLTAVDETVQLTAAAADRNGHPVAGVTFEWTSTDPGVASVDDAGLVTAVGNGTTQILATVTGGGPSGAADVTVQQAAASVEVTPATARLTAVGATVQLQAVAFDENGNPLTMAAFTWTSSNDAVATVDGTGLVTAVADGTATITATSGTASDAAAITVELTQAPSAQDDAYSTPLNTALAVTAAQGVLDNDDLGTPTAAVTHFGGGSLGGAVTDNDAGDVVSFGTGGSLRVNADGSFNFTPDTDFAGTFTFQYRITNTEGTSDATVTIEVRKAPTAVADAYVTQPGVPLSIAAPGVMGNDDRGFPLATVQSFGGGTLGGTVTSNGAGSPIGVAEGEVRLNADGSFTFTPGSGFSGTFTFDYRVSNVVGTSDATVTIEVQAPPDAVDDADTTTVNTTLSVPAPGLLANDDLGAPPAAITSFGGGSLPGDAGQNNAGQTVNFGNGGSLRVNADGSYEFTPMTDSTATFTFQYRLANAVGSDDATVTITVNAPPDATDDAPSATSAPGEAFHTALNTALAGPGGNTPNLLDNDAVGQPAATIASFGGGSLSGDAGTHAAGSNVSGTGGSITVNADGSFGFMPATDFTGLFTFFYRLSNAFGSDDAQVTIAVGARPGAVADNYQTATGHTVLPNVPINTSTATAYSVLANDAGDLLTVTLDGTPANGQVTLNADGTFTLTPNAGFRNGNVTFQYHVANGFGPSAPVTVTVPVGAAGIWFVDNAQSTNGDGRQGTPFNCLTGTGCFSATTADAANDVVFLFTGSGAYTGGLTLLNGQRVIGQGATASLASASGLTVPAHSALPATGGTRPTVTTTAASTNGVNLGQNNTLRGFNVGNTTGAGVAGSNVGTLTVSEVDITGTGQVLNLGGTGTLAATFGTLSTTSTGGGVAGITLSGLGGSLTASTTSLSGTGGAGLSLSNNTAALSFGALTLSPAAGQRGLHATGNTGTISSTSGTVTASNAAAVEVVGTGTATRTPLALTLTAVNANGGTSGIVLTNTSGTGFTVTGSATSGSGGTIQNTTGDAVSLSAANGISLAHMVIQNNADNGIRGTNVTGFAIANSTVSNNGNDAAADEANARFDGLFGTATVTNSVFTLAVEDNFRVRNTSGSLTLTVTGSTFSNTAARPGSNDGLILSAESTASIAATVSGSTFSGNGGDHFQFSPSGTGTHSIMLGTPAGPNTFTCGNASALGCGITMGPANFDAPGTFTYVVQNNTITGTVQGGAINVNKLAGTGTATGTITGNSIGNPAVPNSGCAQCSGIRIENHGAGVHTAQVANNLIREYGSGPGIALVAGDAAGGNGALNVTVTGNTISDPGQFATNGINLNGGTNSGNANPICLDIRSNSMTGSGKNMFVGEEDFRLRQRFLTTVRIPGYTGANDDNTAVVAFVRSRQTGATATDPTGSASNNVSTGGGGFVNTAGGAACPLP